MQKVRKKKWCMYEGRIETKGVTTHGCILVGMISHIRHSDAGKQLCRLNLGISEFAKFRYEV